MKSKTYTPSDPIGIKRGTDGHKSLRTYTDRTHYQLDDIECALYVFYELGKGTDLPWNQKGEFKISNQEICPLEVG